MRRVVGVVVCVVLGFGSVAWGQGAVDDPELAPLASAQELAAAMGARLAERQANWPSSRTREVFREYRRWLAFLDRNGLAEAFVDEVRARSAAMADLVAARFAELVDVCRDGDASVLPQMQELATMAARYPAMVQRLGDAWFAAAEDAIQRCGVPDWYGVASAGQADAFESGYFASIEVTWTLVDVAESVATYTPVVSYASFVIPSGECEEYVVEKADPESTMSFLVVDFGEAPPTYSGTLVLNATIAVKDVCSTPAPPPFRFAAPFPVMVPIEQAPLSLALDVIEGSYEDADTAYQSRWYFSRADRD